VRTLTQKAGQQVAAFVGPPVSGVMAAAGGLMGAALINAMAYTLVIVTLPAVRSVFTPPVGFINPVSAYELGRCHFGGP
jgi:phosphate/sulfate permease